MICVKSLDSIQLACNLTRVLPENMLDSLLFVPTTNLEVKPIVTSA